MDGQTDSLTDRQMGKAPYTDARMHLILQRVGDRPTDGWMDGWLDR